MRFSILIVFFFLNLNAIGQNLVPNPSFEDTVYCPYFTDQMNACYSWNSFGNSPDYFNSCNPFGLNVPNSVFGYQEAHSGNAMAGIVLYSRPNLPSGPNYREFIGAQLTQSLVIGTKYYLSFYVNFSYKLGIACNKASLNFSTVLFDSCCMPPLVNDAILYSDSILSDSVSWFKVSGSFIADSNYNYVVLGNYFNDSLTSKLNLSQFPDAAYYYIDDVCVSQDSLYNQTWTSLKSINEDNLIIYPNPIWDRIYIKNIRNNDEIIIYNQLGQVVFKREFSIISAIVEIPFLYPQGIYFINIKHNTKSSLYKIIKL